jgi:DNA sulfur modification protein DndD
MRIHRISFKDFRQFKGEQTLSFSYDTEKNVTLVFGTNGAGKTTILNAIQWVLYGKFSSDFEQQERLINDNSLVEAGVGAIVEGFVEILFEHGTDKYVMRRTIDGRFTGEGHEIQKTLNPRVSLHVTDRFGESRSMSHPEELIATMFPEKLANFYFFNGERLDKNAGRGFAQLGEAIRTIMGLTKFETALHQIPRVKADFRREMAQLNGETEIEELGEEQVEAVTRRDLQLEKFREATSKKSDIQGKMEEIQMALRGHERSSELQADREENQREMKRAQNRNLEARRDRYRLISSRSALIFMSEMADRTLANSEELRVRGELPRAIKVQFIDDLLSGGACICGTPLNEGSHEHSNVSKWRLKAGHAESEEAWIKVGALAALVQTSQTELIQAIQDASTRISQAELDEKEAHLRVQGIEAQLKGIDVEEIQVLERNLAKLRIEHDETVAVIALADRDINELTQKISEIGKKITAATVDHKKAKIIQRRIDALDEAAQVLADEMRIRSETIRQMLESGINRTYGNIINHDFKVRIDENFVLTLSRELAGYEYTAAKSTAETHALYLSFIAQLSHLNRRLSGATTTKNSPAIEQFPLVMDATFGNFDDEPTRRLVDSLTTLSHQVILLVSKKQGIGIVEEAVKNVCGKKAILTLYATPKDRRQNEQIKVNDVEHDYFVVGSSPFDYTTIKEIV